MSKGINAYSRPTDTGITIDVESMALDLIMVHKAGGTSKAVFIQEIEKIWDESVVTIDTLQVRKQ